VSGPPSPERPASEPTYQSGIVVREAVPADAEGLLTLIDALADYEKLERPTAEARIRLVRDGFTEPRRFTGYIAEIGSEPVGYAITFPTYSSFLALPTLHLEDLFVLPTARSRGVGRAILRHLARRALEEGCGRIDWVVLNWNQLAIDFYEGLGAERLGEWHSYRLSGSRLEELAAR
jgi:GNAT superfamily N-acetyltransferase